MFVLLLFIDVVLDYFIIFYIIVGSSEAACFNLTSRLTAPVGAEDPNISRPGCHHNLWSKMTNRTWAIHHVYLGFWSMSRGVQGVHLNSDGELWLIVVNHMGDHDG